MTDVPVQTLLLISQATVRIFARPKYPWQDQMGLI